MKIKDMLKLALTLAAFAAAVCVMLAFVYAGTMKKITDNQQAAMEEALHQIFPHADFEPVSDIQSVDAAVAIESGYAAFIDGEIAGLVLNVSRAGYGGPIKVLAGISSEGFITGVKIMEHSETPGLGSNAASPSYFVEKGKTFYGQFTGKRTSDAFEVFDDVAAISASTITSRAIALAVKAAAVSANVWLNDDEAHVISGASIGVDK